MKRGYARTVIVPERLGYYVEKDSRGKTILPENFQLKPPPKKSKSDIPDDIVKVMKSLSTMEFFRKTMYPGSTKIYGSVNADDISKYFQQTHRIIVRKEHIEIEKIKVLGNYKAKLKMGLNFEKEFNVLVSEENLISSS